MANWDFERVQDIMRRVIGRRNATDVLSNSNELQKYIGEFLRDIMPQETKNFENFDIYDFSTVANDYLYSFNTTSTDFDGGSGQDESDNAADGQDETQGDQFENIGPVVWSSDPTNSNTQKMVWYQDPVVFYDRWGFIENLADAQTGRPTEILFYNNRFELRPVPDGIYTISIPGFRRNADFTNSNVQDLIPFNYWGRYIAYGASLDYMYDFGYDIERIQIVENRFKYYKGLVHARTFNQFKEQTAIPRF